MSETDSHTQAMADVAEAERRFDKLVTDHRNATATELAEVRRELADAMAELRRSDVDEKEALRKQIAEMDEWIKEQRKAADQRDQVKANKSTMVAPPEDVQVQQQAPQAPEADHEPPRKRGLLNFW